MKGRDLILYILKNHLENEPVFRDNGILVGYMTSEEAAKKFNVPESLIKVWVNADYMDGVLINENLLVPENSVDPRTIVREKKHEFDLY